MTLSQELLLELLLKLPQEQVLRFEPELAAITRMDDSTVTAVGVASGF